jgi:hypothetical protein
MPRRPRVFVNGLVYHVYNRVRRGEAPYNLDDEAERFWALLDKVWRGAAKRRETGAFADRQEDLDRRLAAALESTDTDS